MAKRLYSDGEMMVSPHKNSKKVKAFSEEDANTVLEGQTVRLMLKENADTLRKMEDYAKDLLQKRSITDMSPQAILKTLLLEDWLDDEARICTAEGEKS